MSALAVFGIVATIWVFVLFCLYLMVYIGAPRDEGAVSFPEWQKQHEAEAKRNQRMFYRYGLIGYLLWSYREARARKKVER